MGYPFGGLIFGGAYFRNFTVFLIHGAILFATRLVYLASCHKYIVVSAHNLLSYCSPPCSLVIVSPLYHGYPMTVCVKYLFEETSIA